MRSIPPTMRKVRVKRIGNIEKRGRLLLLIFYRRRGGGKEKEG